MQQIFNFIFKNSHKLLFLLLLIVSLSLTVQFHSFHRSKIISSANFLTGGVYEQVNKINEYFSLRTQNDELAVENARLKTLLFKIEDTLETEVPKINVKGVDNVNLIVSKVIRNAYNTHENYLTISGGKNAGIKQDMGVINSAGIIGIVDKVSDNYSTVISILNVNSKINAKVKKSNHFGSLVWNGKNAGYVQLIDVPRLAQIKKGDTIVTGGSSVIFPQNIGVGTISKVYVDNQTNYYTLDIKLFNDMTNLGHVYIIKSKDRNELLQLEKKENE